MRAKLARARCMRMHAGIRERPARTRQYTRHRPSEAQALRKLRARFAVQNPELNSGFQNSIEANLSRHCSKTRNSRKFAKLDDAVHGKARQNELVHVLGGPDVDVARWEWSERVIPSGEGGGSG